MLPSEEEKIKKLIRSVPYLCPDRTLQDLQSICNHYRGLHVKQEPFVLMNGVTKTLISLQGVIPITHKGNVYNIPVCIWLMETYPNNAPVCYVKPTSDMLIKVSIYVDHSGKIYLPYLHEWSPSNSDLFGLIQIMICTFGDQPPVFAKSNKNKTSPSVQSNQPVPPYPTQCYMPVPTVGGNTPYPQYPMGQPHPPTQSGYSYQYPGMYPQQPSSTAASGYNHPMYPPTPSPSAATASNAGVSGTGTINEEHIRISLLSAVEEKLRRRLEEQYAQSRAELDILQQSGKELAEGKQRLEKIIERLDNDKEELERNIVLLKEKDAELDKELSRLGNQDPIDVDEAVTTTAPLYKQILNAFAEEAATEDAIYYMGEALRRGVIDLDVFLKQVRTLSRKQFMLRALMHKCRQKAGLVG